MPGLFILILLAFLAWLTLRRPATAHPISKCPQCSGGIQASFFRCPHCGTALKHNCPNCSRIIERSWSYCPFCSEAQTAEATTNRSAP